jgi:hypothetical protein
MPENEKDPKELMKQREELLAKLKKLEDKKGATKEKIYLKVKKDYELRLEELNAQLKEQEGVVKERISALKEEASTLQETRESYADRAEELKLRFELGEFEEAEYKEILAEEEARIREVDEKLGSVSDELDSMKGFVGEEAAVEEPAAVEEEQPVMEDEPQEEVAEPVGEEVTEEEAPPQEEPQEEQDTGFVQEKKFEAAFSDEDVGSDDVQKAEIAESLEESIDDLLKENTDAAPTEAAEAEQAVEETETPEAVETTEEEEPAEMEAEAATEGGSEEPQIEQAFDTGILSEGDAIKEETSKLEGFPEDSGGEEGGGEVGGAGDDEEGLQCPKCNFVNSKDSWYCEKCGAELLQ